MSREKLIREVDNLKTRNKALKQAIDRYGREQVAREKMLMAEIRLLREEVERKQERIDELEGKLVEIYEQTRLCEKP